MCALLAWLSVRAQGGEMVLRIEDLDPDRSRQEYIDLLIDDLRWLGLDWDEGGHQIGAQGTYLQSVRGNVYMHYLERLCEQGLVYPCFCSRAELHTAEAPHLSDGTMRYSGRCRPPLPQPATLADFAQSAGAKSPALRLAVPDEAFGFCDGRMGNYGENLAQACGDFIVRRADGVVSYQLAVVVDDALMGITEVTRGGDLLSSTPRQLYLYQLLGFTPPRFYHLPMLLAHDGRRLSKRDRDLDLGELRARFPSPEPLIGWLARLCGLADDCRPIAAKALISRFAWERLPNGDIRLPQELSELLGFCLAN